MHRNLVLLASSKRLLNYFRVRFLILAILLHKTFDKYFNIQTEKSNRNLFPWFYISLLCESFSFVAWNACMEIKLKRIHKWCNFHLENFYRYTKCYNKLSYNKFFCFVFFFSCLTYQKVFELKLFSNTSKETSEPEFLLTFSSKKEKSHLTYLQCYPVGSCPSNAYAMVLLNI